MGLKKWIYRRSDKALAKEISEEFGFNPAITMLAVARGYTEPWQIDELLSDEIFLSNPLEIKDMDRAVERVRRAVDNGEKIRIFGDYDCDGVTATVLLYSYLKGKGADVSYVLPRRGTDGYGLNSGAVEESAKDGIKLLLTVDNGITAMKEIETAKKLGIDVVVTDHHLPLDTLPDAYCVVDPNRADDTSECNNLCGVGVAFMLASAVEGVAPEEMLPRFSELIALGTVADVVPLLNDNRRMVKYGIAQINENPSPGIAALVDVCGVKPGDITATTVAYNLAPRINAAGRICDAGVAAKLLLSDHLPTALSYAGELNDNNSERHEIERGIINDAVDLITAGNLARYEVLVVAKAGWHCGVTGIAASRLVEKYGKPCFLFSIDGDGIATGSGRSVHGFDLFKALCRVSHLLQRFGGHSEAAGATIDAANIDEFRNSLNEYALCLPHVFTEVTVDCKLNAGAISPEFVNGLSALEPYGSGNKPPLFALCRMKITSIDIVGKEKQHMRLRLEKGGKFFGVIAFSSSPADYGISVGDTVDVAVSLSVKEYNGKSEVSVIVRDIKLSERDEEKFFGSLENYRKCVNNLPGADYEEIYPIREEFAAVYRFIRQYGEITLPGLQNRMCDTVSPGKIEVILECFRETGLLSVQSNGGENTISVKAMAEKVDLTKCECLRRIAEKREQNGNGSKEF